MDNEKTVAAMPQATARKGASTQRGINLCPAQRVSPLTIKLEIDLNAIDEEIMCEIERLLKECTKDDKEPA